MPYHLLMIRDIKDIIVNYSIVGIVIALLTMLVRPFVCIKQTIRDAVIVFVFTVLTGLLLENWKDVLEESVRTGISGVCGFFAVRIYEIIIALLDKAKENPESIFSKFKE